MATGSDGSATSPDKDYGQRLTVVKRLMGTSGEYFLMGA